MAIDIARARAETPSCAKVAHFNNAGAALMPRAVLDAQIDHLRLEGEMGGYEAAAAAADKIAGTYSAVARLLNCTREEVALVENATVAWNQAFYAFDFKPGDRILTAEAEYAANYIAYLKVAKDHGAVVEVVPSDDTGQLSVAALEAMIDDKVKLISVTHVPTNGGLVNPAAEIGKVARAAGIPFLLDACQSAGQLALDVEDLGCDLLSVTGRKYLRGPRGSGFLYVRKAMLERLDPPMPDLHAATWVERDRYELRPDARRFENWEFNYAAIVGLGVAVDYALGWGLEAIEDRVVKLAHHLRLRLDEELGLPVYDLGARKCGIVTTALPGIATADVRNRLHAQGINASYSTPNSTRIDAEKRDLPDLLRLSVHYYNDEDEIDRLIQALREIKG
ncbi:MAG: aminotransferase class V-fold PLP-dependent enzyme [Kiloniellales bacterium]|nr:aminotransferase class V-fold PLP-dependent enzyme [Kiloniellales bacterium]